MKREKGERKRNGKRKRIERRERMEGDREKVKKGG
jgi:hypothetical protein